MMQFLGTAGLIFSATLLGGALLKDDHHKNATQRERSEQLASDTVLASRNVVSLRRQKPNSGALEELLERPLFAPDRKRRNDAPAVVVVIEPPLVSAIEDRIPLPPVDRPTLTILGVFAGPDGHSAFIEQPQSESEWVEIGDQIENWTVVEISEEQIVLAAPPQSSTPKERHTVPVYGRN